MLNKFDKNKNPFKVPEGYFDNFSSNLMDQLPSKETKVVKKVHLFDRILPWAAVAAIFIGVVVSVGVFDQDISPLNNQNEKESLDKSIANSNIEDEDFYFYMQDETIASMYDESLYLDD